MGVSPALEVLTMMLQRIPLLERKTEVMVDLEGTLYEGRVDFVLGTGGIAQQYVVWLYDLDEQVVVRPRSIRG